MFSGERCLNGEALILADVLFRRCQNLTRGRNRKSCRATLTAMFSRLCPDLERESPGRHPSSSLSEWFYRNHWLRRRWSVWDASTGGRGRLGLLFPLSLSKDFLQALSFNSHASAGSLGHLLREFDPVHSHTHRIRPSWSRLSVFLKRRRFHFSQRMREAGHPAIPSDPRHRPARPSSVQQFSASLSSLCA